jgi:hypothetical protein
MSRIEIFDPPMCCSSGVCGPVVDPVLPRFAADLRWLRKQGVEVLRHNVATDPSAFVETEVVRSAMEAHGQSVLPMVVADGRIVSQGAYPTREVLASLLTTPTADGQPGRRA